MGESTDKIQFLLCHVLHRTDTRRLSICLSVTVTQVCFLLKWLLATARGDPRTQTNYSQTIAVSQLINLLL